MKSVVKYTLAALCVFVVVSAGAQTTDTVKHNSALDLINLENNKNLVPKSNSQPLVMNADKSATNSRAKKAKRPRVKIKKKSN